MAVGLVPVWMGFNLLLMVIYPTFIAPLFNKFQPLEDESLKARVTASCSTAVSRPKGPVCDGRQPPAHANAYFTGFGAAKRVVFYDTLRQLAPGEVEPSGRQAGPFQAPPHRPACRDDFALSLAGFALLGWLSTQVVVLHRAGGPQFSLDPAVAAAP